MPDRFDLSTSADLEASLDMATRFCRLASFRSLSASHRSRLGMARHYLVSQEAVVRAWLIGSPSTLAPDSIIPSRALPLETGEELREFGAKIEQLTPDIMSLAARKDTAYAVAPHDGRIMGRDFARHLVRIICISTIDLGWGYDDLEAHP